MIPGHFRIQIMDDFIATCHKRTRRPEKSVSDDGEVLSDWDSLNRDNEGTFMGENEYCQFVTFLIPKYIKGQCANAERTLVDEHCAGCQECRLKLTRAIAAAKAKPVKEVLFLSRPKNLKKPQRLGGNEKEQGKKGNPPSVSGGDFAIDWKDKVLESRMREITGIHSRDIMCSDVKTIKKLKLSRGSYNPIRNISALSNLTNLEELNLSCNMISDISALSNLTNLRDLNLIDNQIRYISALRNLTSLKKLALKDNKISDISALNNLTDLEELNLIANRISDISALGNLTKLKRLFLGFNQISDISVLSNLIRLEVLGLRSNRISDISALSKLKKLRGLELNFNEIRDIEALSNLTKLSWLELSWNQITDYSPIEKLKIARVFK